MTTQQGPQNRDSVSAFSTSLAPGLLDGRDPSATSSAPTAMLEGRQVKKSGHGAVPGYGRELQLPNLLPD